METCYGLVLKEAAPGNHKLGPQYLPHATKSAGGSLTTYTNNKSCLILQTQGQGLDGTQYPIKPGKRWGQPSHKCWAGHDEPRFYPRVTLLVTPWDSVFYWSHSGAWHTCYLNFSLLSFTHQMLFQQAQCTFSGHLPSFTQSSKCWENYTANKTDCQNKDNIRKCSDRQK